MFAVTIRTGVATCRPCRPGLQLFLESQKKKIPKNAIKIEGQRGDIKAPNRFKYHQNAPFTVLVFIYCSLQFQIISNPVTIHALVTLLSSISHLSECMLYLHCFDLFLRRQNTCFRDIVFKTFSAVPNHFKSRHNTCFSYIAFIYFSVVRMHALLTLLSSISQSSEYML